MDLIHRATADLQASCGARHPGTGDLLVTDTDARITCPGCKSPDGMPPLQDRAEPMDVTEVAATVRRLLRRAFPGVKFTVRSSRYSMGSSVGVRWVDGPANREVDAVIRPFTGTGAAGVDDYAPRLRTWVCAEHGAAVASSSPTVSDPGGSVLASRCCSAARLRSLGSTHAHGSRSLSAEVQADLQAMVSEVFLTPYDDTKRVDGEWMGTWVYRFANVPGVVAPTPRQVADAADRIGPVRTTTLCGFRGLSSASIGGLRRIVLAASDRETW